jgi:ribosomal protein S18 acetylase RimI-like enzyme
VNHWLELNLRGMQAAFRAFAEAAGSRLIEGDGLIAAVSAEVPERSVFNSVVYLDPPAFAAAREEIVAVYADAGNAWTVWVPEGDTETAGLLEAAGHTLDAQPRAMGIELEGIEEPDLSGIDWTLEGDGEAMSSLNDEAYGYPEGTWIRGMGRPGPEVHVYLASLDGEPAATVSARDADGDCSIWCVATAEWARGRGLSTALMRQALFDAQQRGCATSTLQATKLGAPVYRRCGYQDFGALGMWEFRPPELSHHAAPAAAA